MRSGISVPPKTRKKPKPKPKTLAERNRAVDASKLLPMLGTLFFSKDPVITQLATQTIPELTGMRGLAGMGENVSAMHLRGGSAQHALVQLGRSLGVERIPTAIHELAHVLQRLPRAGEAEAVHRTVAPVQQILETEIGAWSPSVQRGVPGGIKTIQDISRSQSLPSYFRAYLEANPQRASQLAKGALIQARQAGGIQSAVPAVERASRLVLSPEILKRIKQLLQSKEALQKLGPQDLRTLATLPVEQAFRQLIGPETGTRLGSIGRDVPRIAAGGGFGAAAAAPAAASAGALSPMFGLIALPYLLKKLMPSYQLMPTRVTR